MAFNVFHVVLRRMDDVELQAACAALGYLDGDEYHKEPDCLGITFCLIISI